MSAKKYNITICQIKLYYQLLTSETYSWLLFLKSSQLESSIQIGITQINKIKYITAFLSLTLGNEFCL